MSKEFEIAEKFLDQANRILDVVLGKKSVDEVTEQRYLEYYKFIPSYKLNYLTDRIKKVRAIVQSKKSGFQGNKQV